MLCACLVCSCKCVLQWINCTDFLELTLIYWENPQHSESDHFQARVHKLICELSNVDTSYLAITGIAVFVAVCVFANVVSILSMMIVQIPLKVPCIAILHTYKFIKFQPTRLFEVYYSLNCSINRF